MRPRRPHERPSVRCVRCGAPGDARQQLCLHCGARMPKPPRRRPQRPSAGARERPQPARRGGPPRARPRRRALRGGLTRERAWLALALALAAAAGAGIALGSRNARNASAPTLVSPGSHVTVTIGTTSRTPTTRPPATAPTITTGTLPTAPGPPSTAVTTTPPPPTTTPRPPRTGGVASWPRSRRGYTVVLVSIAESDGRGSAVAEAKRAARNGLDRVGVLLSSEHSSLHPGYWVVFFGVYGSQRAAQAALAAAHAHGYPGAYPALVAP